MVHATGSLERKGPSSFKLEAEHQNEAFKNRFAAEHKKLLAGMSSQERSEFLQVVTQLGNPAHGPASKVTKHNLIELAQSGELFQKDSGGQTILEQLASYLHKPLDSTVSDALAAHPKAHYKHSVLQSLINTLANPKNITQGHGTYTCTTTDLEVLMQRTSPADFTRFALGLAFDGSGVTPSGTKIPLDTSQLDGDLARNLKDDRSLVGALIQGSLYAYAENNYNADGSRKFGGGRGGMLGSYGGKGGGLTEGQVSGLFDSVFGIKTSAMTVTPANRDEVKEILKQTLDSDWLSRKGNDHSAGIPIGITEPGGFGHELLLNRIQAGVAYFTNPATGAASSMPVSQLLKRLDAVVVPTEIPPAIRQQMQQIGMSPLGTTSMLPTALWGHMVGTIAM